MWQLGVALMCMVYGKLKLEESADLDEAESEKSNDLQV